MTLEQERQDEPVRHRGTYIDELLILRSEQPTQSVPVPFEEIVNWQLHPTRPVAPIAHRKGKRHV